MERCQFIDESSINLALTRLYGRAPRGERVVDRVPQNYGENITMVAALGLEGISAPMTINGAVDGEVFRVYVEEVLGPTLQPGDIVVMDNLPAHKGGGPAQRLRNVERESNTCHPTRRTSTRLRSVGRRSRPPCGLRKPGPARRWGQHSSKRLRRSARRMCRHGLLIVVIPYTEMKTALKCWSVRGGRSFCAEALVHLRTNYTQARRRSGSREKCA
jgi:hypothetical protein